MPFNPFKYSKRKRRTSTTDFQQLSSQQDNDTASVQSLSSSFDSGSQILLIPNQNNNNNNNILTAASSSGSLNNSSSSTSSPKIIVGRHNRSEEELEIIEGDASSSLENNEIPSSSSTQNREHHHREHSNILRQSTADLSSINDFTSSLIQDEDVNGSSSSHAMIELAIENDDQMVFGSPSPTSNSPSDDALPSKKTTTPRRRASFNSLDRSASNIQRVSSDVDNNENDRRIQRQIELDSKKPKKVRILTLGSGKSGKSTLIRKIKLLEGDYSNEQVVELFKCKILKFVLNNAKYLIKNVTETEFRENLRRRAQLLQLWRFNQTLNTQNECNSDSAASNNTSQSIPITPKNKSPLRVSSSLDESLNVLHQRLSNFKNDSKQFHKQPSQYDTQSEESNKITQNFLNPEAVELFKSLWKDKYVKHTFDKLSLNNSILYNARYFFDNIDRIASLRYTPTSRDILTTYFPSTSIETCQLNFPFPCEFVDITGQRNERRKWMTSHFDRDSVSAIVFMVSLSEYCEYSLSLLDFSPTKNPQSPPIVDPLNFVPPTQNQILVSHMHNSLSMFKEILSFYKDTPIILVFTKLDIFRKRIKSVPLRMCFPDFDYSGDHVFLYTSFVAEKFINVDPTIRQRCLYTHFVDLIREDASLMVMDDIKDIILQKTLRDHGLF
ncbi:predicted protein [Naegleria gruberi]|uniref:Predicted protein n=1 Tax=Naegleria gruberi TaxID=5762 RepID=D2VM46_NAEGR|nr:uncharacterized protein NAEGRDRAFT_70007 [Naegleria gruberi]EFC42256.1 predicted protein [Naegleria gruberi]|eukprot:XP_002675000.1 predicted protein [Naegleria gruberi strain NEG-M]